jgi:hypothetical protein
MNQPENYTLLWAFSTRRLRRGMNPPATPTRPDEIRPARLSEAPFRVAGIVWIARQRVLTTHFVSINRRAEPTEQDSPIETEHNSPTVS